MIRSKAALALLTALGTATLAPTVHAGPAFAEDISQNVTIAVPSHRTDGDGRSAPNAVKKGYVSDTLIEKGTVTLIGPSRYDQPITAINGARKNYVGDRINPN